jgi:glycine/D-amino acid oxidase-like deaminating enzyme
MVGSASKAAGAMLNYCAEVTTETFKNKYSTAKFNMAYRAAKIWPLWVEELNNKLPKEKEIIIDDGTFVILNAKSGPLDTDNYEAIIKALNDYNENYEEINPKDVIGLNPLDDCRPLRAMYLQNEGAIPTSKVIQSLNYILSQCENIKFINDTVSKINLNPSNTQIDSVITYTGNTIKTKNVILAAGVYNQNIIDTLPQIKDNIPRILSGVGHSAIIEQSHIGSIKHVIRTPNRSGACGLHVLPHGEKHLYIGATNNISFKPMTETRVGLSQFLLQCTIEQIDQLLYNSKVINWQTGNRPVTIDTFPLIGKTSIEGLSILTGTYRDGFHQAPLLAEFITKEILGK